MDRWKSTARKKLRQGESQKREGKRGRRSEMEKGRKQEDAGAPKGRKVANHCVLPMFDGPGGSRSRLAKAAGAEPAGQRREEKVNAVVARLRLTLFVAQSTFGSEKLQSTSVSDHFWKLRCRQSARQCGANRIWK